MSFFVLTLFPEMVYAALNTSITGRAINQGIINIKCVDIRDFSGNKHRRVDDYPYGGGAGMVMKAQPVFEAFQSIKAQLNPGTKVVYMSPAGAVFNQERAAAFSLEKDIVILCGHYEGIDQRVIDEIVTDEISLGDFILTGGEIAAIAVIDAVARLIPGVLGASSSLEFESFTDNLLEYPHYTRPFDFMGKTVPEVLISGNHKEIEKWRLEKSKEITIAKRPDLL